MIYFGAGLEGPNATEPAHALQVSSVHSPRLPGGKEQIDRQTDKMPDILSVGNKATLVTR